MQHASLDAFAITITGRRSHNEDAILARADLGLFVVADGMGGYEGGEVASAIAVDAIGGLVRHTAGGDNVSWPFPIDAARTPDENELAVAIRIAGARIAAQRTGALGQMGATVAALRFARGHAAVAHVGDSRVYRLRDGALEQLTTDHSLAAELTAAGTPPGEGFAWRHVVTRAPGAQRFTDLAIRIEQGPVAGEGIALRSDLPYAEAKAAVLHDLERRYLADVLARTAGNLSAASRASGIDRKHLRTIARKHGLVAAPAHDDADDVADDTDDA